MTHMAKATPYNIAIDYPGLVVGEDAPTSLGQFLSNFTATPFEFFNIEYTSMEGFHQGLRYPSGSPGRIELASLSGVEAQRVGNSSPANIDGTVGIPMFEFWGGRIFNRTRDHLDIISLATRAKVFFFPDKAEEFRTSSGTVRVKDSERSGILTKVGVIESILEEIRQEIRSGKTPDNFLRAQAVMEALVSTYLRSSITGEPVFNGAGGIP